MPVIKWLSNPDRGFVEAGLQNMPILLYFCSDNCYFCQRISMMVYRQPDVADLIGQELVAVRITPETPDVFRTHSVTRVPTWIVIGAKGFEYERHSGYLDAEELEAFILLALGKFYHDRRDIDTALRYIERLVIGHPESPYSPEGMFLCGLCRFLRSGDPQHFKEAFLQISQAHPASIWSKRSLVFYAHPSAVTEWAAACRQHLNYWDSEDAFAKCFATYFYPLTEQQHKDDNPPK